MKLKVLFSGWYPRVITRWHSRVNNEKPNQTIADKIFGKYLFITNTISSGILMGVGDIIQQELEIYRGHHKGSKLWKRYDWQRIHRMFWVGLILGPPQHVFYGYIDKLLPKRDFASVSKKILLDQIVISPVCIAVFFVGMGVLEGNSASEIKSEMRNKFLFVYTMDWMVWPPAQYLNFYCLLPKYRVLYINFVTMLYDIFLSYAKYDIGETS
ncbi:Mpv17-like protein [Gryllus bimaculatus]|nr:Mpv17-like protein [Gryllus bimaculatus]